MSFLFVAGCPLIRPPGSPGVAMGILIQFVGLSYRAIAFLFKYLNPTISGWQPCLRVLAAATELSREVLKITLFLPIIVCSTHHLLDLLSCSSVSLLRPSSVQAFSSSVHRKPSNYIDIQFFPKSSSLGHTYLIAPLIPS